MHFLITTNADRIWEIVAVFDVYRFLPVQGGAGRSQLRGLCLQPGVRDLAGLVAFTLERQMWLSEEADVAERGGPLDVDPESAGRAGSEMSKRGHLLMIDTGSYLHSETGPHFHFSPLMGPETF